MTKLARLALAGLAIAAASPAVGALAPKEQRLREIQAVAGRAAGLLPDPIEAVEFLGPDRYRVRSDRCTIEVVIVDARPAVRAVPVVGRRRFRVTTAEPQCR